MPVRVDKNSCSLITEESEDRRFKRNEYAKRWRDKNREKAKEAADKYRSLPALLPENPLAVYTVQGVVSVAEHQGLYTVRCGVYEASFTKQQAAVALVSLAVSLVAVVYVIV
jgi:hypothetical protein